MVGVAWLLLLFKGNSEVPLAIVLLPHSAHFLPLIDNRELSSLPVELLLSWLNVLTVEGSVVVKLIVLDRQPVHADVLVSVNHLHFLRVHCILGGLLELMRNIIF